MLDVLIHQQMNIISLGVLLLFLVYAFYAMDINSKLNKVYLTSLLINVILLCLEIILFLISDLERVPTFLSNLIGSLICALSPLLAYLFLQLVCLYFPNPYKIKKPAKSLLVLLMVINVIVAGLSFKSKMFSDNYELTSLVVPFLICIIYISCSIYVIYKSKKVLIISEGLFITAVSIITNVSILVQFFLNETRFIFVSSSFTLILMFIVIQQKELYRDPLTGARNRLVLKKCITKFTNRKNKMLSVVMMDLDYFKNINDTYGHAEGDHVLRVFVKMLQKVFSDEGIVIRMGGDEFLILINDAADKQVDEMMARLSRIVDRYNNKGTKPYRIKYSYATGTYNNDNISVDQFIHEIDIQMYINKKKKRINSTNKREKLFNFEGR